MERDFAALFTPVGRPSILPEKLLRPMLLQAFYSIVKVDTWGNDFLDLVEEAHNPLQGSADGEVIFGTLTGFLDAPYGSRGGSACAELSWQAAHENDQA